MRKALIEGLLIVVSFFAVLYLLRQVEWVNIFNFENVTKKTEEKLGDVLWDVYKETERESKDKYVEKSIESLVDRICEMNYFKREFIRVHILEKDEVNAFALPNGYLMIYTGLIRQCDNQEELAGIICHEIAHIQLNHVMKKLIREMGLSMLIGITTGNGNSETTKNAARLLSSSAFERTQEKEADIQAVDYLIDAHIDPEPFADFLNKLSEKENDLMKYLTWASTHPDSKERSNYILESCREKTIIKDPVLATATWEQVQLRLGTSRE